MRSPFFERNISRCSSYSRALSLREAMLLVLLSMSGNPTLPVGELCGDVAVGGGGGGGATEGCDRVIWAGVGSGGGELRTNFGRCAADIARRLWKEAADVYDRGMPGGSSGGGAR